jgi:OmpA-OmpF porin, OOP family
VIVQGNKAGYKQGTVSTDVVKENTSSVIIKLEPETNNTLQEQLEQKGKIELYGIYFDTDKATLKPESEKTLKQLLAFINANPGTALEFGGHTDAQGDNAYNLQLSQQRAEAVISWLKANKATVTNLSAKGYGETEPVADNSTETGRALNRRVEIKHK